MAGLQQYNFFPTNLFYPRPQPQPQPQTQTQPQPSTVPPLQTPQGEIIRTEDLQPQNQQPRSMIKVPPSSPAALVYSQKRQSLSGIDKKVSKFSTNPLSWLVWMAEEEDLDTL